jgi:hypothetical protein
MPPEVVSGENEAAVEAVVESNQDVNAAESSSASEGVEKPTYLESVEAALKDGTEASPASEDGKEKEDPKTPKSGEAAEGGEGEKLPEITDEEINSYPPNSQRRIRELVAQRDEERAKIETLEALRPRAEQMDRITAYMQDHDIQPGEVDNALAITALINKGDYPKALEALTPIYREIAAKAGEILPDDLKEDVRLGRITEERARELNRARATATSATEREQRDRERDSKANEERQHKERVYECATACEEWAKGKAGSDPDWNLKHQLVADEMELVLLRGGPGTYPKNKQEAVAAAEKALETVEGRLKTLRPKPEPHRTVTGQFASPHSKSKPATYEEAIDQALAG